MSSEIAYLIAAALLGMGGTALIASISNTTSEVRMAAIAILFLVTAIGYGFIGFLLRNKEKQAEKKHQETDEKIWNAIIDTQKKILKSQQKMAETLNTMAKTMQQILDKLEGNTDKGN